MAGQIVSRVRDTFQVEANLRVLMEASTIAEMAVVITQYQARQIGQQELARLIAETETLPEEEVAQRITDEKGRERKDRVFL